TAFVPIRSGNANEQRQACGPNLPHRLYDLENDADAILEAAAKLILPKIAEGRKELVQQISMGGVNLQDFESRRASALRRPSKSVHDFANLAGRECTGPGVVLIKAYRARGNRLGFPDARQAMAADDHPPPNTHTSANRLASSLVRPRAIETV